VKALTLTAYNEFTYGEAPEPEVPPGHVRVSVGACGICGSDVHGMDGSSGRRIPPLIMGHEAAGTIESVGQGVVGWAPGDRVTFDSMLSCGECDDCRAGRSNLCPSRRVLGVSCVDYRQHGAFAEMVTLPSHVLLRLPDGIAMEDACLAEPVSVALHAVRRVPVRPGDTAVVIGAGIIGLLVIQALKLAGCGRVIAVDLDSRRLALARELGADDALVSDRDRVLQHVRASTGGDGADLAMEVVGVGPTVALAVDCVRKGGSVGLVGNLAAGVEFPLQSVVTREVSLFGSCASAGEEFAEALRLIADGSVRVRPLVSAVADLAEGAGWFQRLHDNKEGLIKVILRPATAGRS
jgi:L-iditol 2-dehydrogenase